MRVTKVPVTAATCALLIGCGHALDASPAPVPAQPGQKAPAELASSDHHPVATQENSFLVGDWLRCATPDCAYVTAGWRFMPNGEYRWIGALAYGWKVDEEYCVPDREAVERWKAKDTDTATTADERLTYERVDDRHMTLSKDGQLVHRMVRVNQENAPLCLPVGAPCSTGRLCVTGFCDQGVCRVDIFY